MLKEASDAEEELSQQKEIVSEEPSLVAVRPRVSSFLAKRGDAPEQAVEDLKALVSDANKLNADTAEGSRSEEGELDAALAAVAKEATDKLTSMALKFSEAAHSPGTSFGYSAEETKMHEEMRAAIKSSVRNR